MSSEMINVLVSQKIKQKRGHSRRRNSGVTLIEVLIVVAILSLIAGGVAIFAFPKFKEAQVKTAQTDTKSLYNVVESWKMNHPGSSDCPKFEDLKASKDLKGDQNTNDPWGRPYKIICSGDEIGITSAGPDGKEGNEDDIWAGTRPSK